MFVFPVAALIVSSACGFAQTAPLFCARPPVGSVVAEPEDLNSKDGILSVELTYRNIRGPNGKLLYCYLYKDGAQAPTLRLQPGDFLILRLKNELTQVPASGTDSARSLV
jgi:FtsP/CotA-like multicopper oxidase with cupredoxin domain